MESKRTPIRSLQVNGNDDRIIKNLVPKNPGKTLLSYDPIEVEKRRALVHSLQATGIEDRIIKNLVYKNSEKTLLSYDADDSNPDDSNSKK